MKTKEQLEKQMRKKLLIEVSVDDNVKNKYPNFVFNYVDKEDFFINNIVPSLENVPDEREYDNGYTTIIANGMLDTIEEKFNIGDKVAFIRKSGYMGKNALIKIGRIVDIEENGISKIYTIEYQPEKQKSSVKRKADEMVSIYDLLEEL